MSDKGEGGVKNLKKWVTSFMDGPLDVCFFTVNYFCRKFPIYYYTYHLEIYREFLTDTNKVKGIGHLDPDSVYR